MDERRQTPGAPAHKLNVRPLGALVRDVGVFYRKLRRPIAFALVIIAVFPRIVPIPNVQLAALVALGLIIFETLLEIQKQLTSDKPARVFPNFYSVCQEINQAIVKRLERRSEIHIRALGMSMGHAWPFFANTLQPLLSENRKQKVTLEIAMLDSRWAELDSVNPDWLARSKTNCDEIQRFVEERRAQLEKKRWSVTVHLYRHMPNWHGVMIDEDILFLSTCYWDQDKLVGADNLYERFDKNADEVSSRRISEFTSWFGRIRNNSAL